MTRIRHYPILGLILLLTGIACQLSTAVPATTTVNPPANSTTESSSPRSTTVPIRLNNPFSFDLEERLISIYEQINPSVVHIFVFDQQEQFLNSGSGFVYDESGYIVTNYHVVGIGSRMEVIFADGQRRWATITGTDIDSDLAVIQVESLPPGVRAIPLGDSNTLRVGQFVVAIGNPFGAQSSMSVGIISGLGRSLESQHVIENGTFSIPQVIQTDAAINPGNSGGPLLNLNGEVIGVNSAISSQTGLNSGVGYSIPSNAVRNIAPALIENGEYIYPYIGIGTTSRPFTLSELEELGLPPNGVFITSVTPGTAADEAGLIGHDLAVEFTADGDYITAIDGHPIRSSDELLSYLVFETKVGQTIKFSVLRDGEEVIVPLTLGARP